MAVDPPLDLANRSRPLKRVNGMLTGRHEPYLQGLLRDRMSRGRTARVLDLGFGEGRALLEFAWEFRDEDVDFSGIDGARIPPVQSQEDLATMMDVFGIGPASDLRLPEIRFRRLGIVGNEARRTAEPGVLPYEANTFDVVYSAAVIRLIPDKALVLEEVCRVLRPGGVAVLDIDDSATDYPTGSFTEAALLDTWSRFMILDDDAFVPPIRHLWRAAGDDYSISFAQPARLALRVDKHSEARLELGLVYDADLSLNRARLPVRPDTGGPIGGTRSVYRVAR